MLTDIADEGFSCRMYTEIGVVSNIGNDPGDDPGDPFHLLQQ